MIEEKYALAGHYNDDRVEFHVDTCAFLHEGASRRYKYGGKTSIRVKLDAHNKASIIFGQDDSVFHQYLLSTRQWVGPKGELPFVPKSDGAGVMVSAFLCRDFGLGLKINQQQLEEINFYRRRGKCYKDEGVVMEVFRTSV
jgi:hypothetical protein